MARSDLNWEASRNSIVMEKLWEDDGYAYELVKRYMSKDYYNVTKNGTTINFAVYSDPKAKAKKQYEYFLHTFENIVNMHFTYDGKKYIPKV